MAFGRLHEEARKCPKLLALSDAAWRMWGNGVIYCQDELTDGFIPDHAIETFGVRSGNKRKVADELCTVLVPGKQALWHKVPGGYQVNDYLDWNDSRETILAKRLTGKGRVQRFRSRLGGNAGGNALQHHVHKDRNSPGNAFQDAGNALQNAEQEACNAGGVPSPPHPPSVPRSTNTHSAREADTPGLRQRSSLLTGTLPREHAAHAWCGDYRKCVPGFLHSEFLGGLGGDPAVATEKLFAFYDRTMAEIAPEAVISEPPPAFWRSRFTAAFPSTIPSPVTTRFPKASGPTHTSVDTGKYAGVTQGDD